jgi:hypothetical protein
VASVSVDTDDGRRSERGYGRTRVEQVDVFVSDRFHQYTDWARVDAKRSTFGQRLIVQVLHKNATDCPE